MTLKERFLREQSLVPHTGGLELIELRQSLLLSHEFSITNVWRFYYSFIPAFYEGDNWSYSDQGGKNGVESFFSRFLRSALFIHVVLPDVNVSYGIPVAIGLYFIGVPNAVLWGAFAAVLRSIPYIGPWIGAALPIALSLAVSPNWTMPLLTIGLFVVLELLSNNLMEPWPYGSSTGVTPIALIVAAVFWTWLWGPVAHSLDAAHSLPGRHRAKRATPIISERYVKRRGSSHAC